MSSQEIQDLLSRQSRLKGQRDTWMDHWQDLAEVFLPGRADFTVQRTAGERRTERIFDSTPMIARRGLSATLDSLLKPRSQRWFTVFTGEDALDEDREVKVWLDVVNERLWRSLYNPRSRFSQRSAETDDDLTTFGSGILLILEGRNRLVFRSLHLKRVVFAEDEDGQIDTLMIEMEPTVRQAAQRYGLENLGAKSRELLSGSRPQPDKRIKVLWAIRPRRERDPRAADNRDFAFSSTVIDVESEHVIAESGFREFPAAIPRWDTRAEELYGRSPAMLALPDANTLQQMGKTNLIAGHKVADPPLLAASDAIFGTPRTFPGGVTYFDAAMARDLGGRVVTPLQTGGNIPLTREMQNDTRDQIFAAFFRNVLNLPIDAPQMTATEVLERKDEFIRTIGPVFSRLEDDYPAVIVRRAFRILLRAGVFPPPPERLRQRSIRFRFQSAVEQSRRQIEAAGAARAFELMAPLGSVQPEIWDNFDGDRMARDVPETFGLPTKWMRDLETRDGLRNARAEAQQQAEALATAGATAEIAATAAKVEG